MIHSPIEYTPEESKFIEDHKKDFEINGNFWNDSNADGPELKKNKKALRKSIKEYYCKVQGYRCVYCQQEFKAKHGRQWDVEHIAAKSLYPRFMYEPQNLCVSCIECNEKKLNAEVFHSGSKKLNKIPEKSDAYIIVHPHLDKYEDHIEVIKVAALYKPKTPKGQKTIEMCGLLRFAYAYSDSNTGDLDTDQLIQGLMNQWSKTDDPLQKQHLFDYMIYLNEEGKKKAFQKMTVAEIPE